MRVLAMDTARNAGSVALLRDGEVAECVSLGLAPGFDEKLFGAVTGLLDRHGTRLAEIDAFAAATGPGSFTGIRVGLSAAKALAEAGGQPLAGVSSLRTLAAAAKDAGPGARAALLDARRGELFAGFYDDGGRSLAPETAGNWDSLAPCVDELGAVLVWNEPGLFADGGPAAAAAGYERVEAAPELAGTVAALAALDLAAGLGSPPEAIEANYIRRPSMVPPGPPQATSR